MTHCDCSVRSGRDEMRHIVGNSEPDVIIGSDKDQNRGCRRNNKDLCRHLGSRAISCSNVHGVFPVHELSGFALSKCLQPNFVVCYLFPWHVRATEQMCRYLLRQPLLRIWGLLTVLFHTLNVQEFAQVRWRRISMTFSHSYRSSCKTRAEIENSVQTLAQTVAAQTAEITQNEQIVGSLVARVTSLETNAASGSSSLDSRRSSIMFGQSTGSHNHLVSQVPWPWII